MTIPLVIGVNPLQTTLFELGIVSGRVALLLRSAEIHPVFVRFVQMDSVHPLFFSSPCKEQLQEGLLSIWAVIPQGLGDKCEGTSKVQVRM
jgi:hypothetical protein